MCFGWRSVSGEKSGIGVFLLGRFPPPTEELNVLKARLETSPAVGGENSMILLDTRQLLDPCLTLLAKKKVC